MHRNWNGSKTTDGSLMGLKEIGNVGLKNSVENVTESWKKSLDV